ncbi:hypothetical protein [Micromonospora parva]|uniref:hypothetical protein n=1 Tax=Micromonospora parva TaxID=1464048 RepID=UPI00364877FD
MSRAGPGRPLTHWQHRLAERGVDRQLWLLVPALVFVIALFLYPFFYGLTLSFQPTTGGPFSDYARFFPTPTSGARSGSPCGSRCRPRS